MKPNCLECKYAKIQRGYMATMYDPGEPDTIEDCLHPMVTDDLWAKFEAVDYDEEQMASICGCFERSKVKEVDPETEPQPSNEDREMYEVIWQLMLEEDPEEDKAMLEILQTVRGA